MNDALHSVPPADIRLLEALGAAAWPASEVQIVDGWQLGVSVGISHRANSVLPLGELEERQLDDAIDEVEWRYASRGLNPCFKMTVAALPSELGPALDRRGYTIEKHSQVLVADAAAVAAREDGRHGVHLLDTPEAHWAAVCWSADQYGDEAAGRFAIANRLPEPRGFALAEVGGTAGGAGIAIAQGEWACLNAINVLPAFRRQGLARAVVTALAAWAVERGAWKLYLQVEVSNAPARRLYDQLGFHFAYAYHYRTLHR